MESLNLFNSRYNDTVIPRPTIDDNLTNQVPVKLVLNPNNKFVFSDSSKLPDLKGLDGASKTTLMQAANPNNFTKSLNDNNNAVYNYYLIPSDQSIALFHPISSSSTSSNTLPYGSNSVKLNLSDFTQTNFSNNQNDHQHHHLNTSIIQSSAVKNQIFFLNDKNEPYLLPPNCSTFEWRPPRKTPEIITIHSDDTDNNNNNLSSLDINGDTNGGLSEPTSTTIISDKRKFDQINNNVRHRNGFSKTPAPPHHHYFSKIAAVHDTTKRDFINKSQHITPPEHDRPFNLNSCNKRSPSTIATVVEYRSLKENMEYNKTSLMKKLLTRRPVTALIDQGIMPPLTTPVSIYERKHKLEKAKKGDYLKQKIQKRPDRSQLVQQHILQDTAVDPHVAETHRVLKRAKLMDNLNDRLSRRPGPLDLVRANYLVLPTLTKATTEIENDQEESPKSFCDFQADLVEQKTTAQNRDREPSSPYNFDDDLRDPDYVDYDEGGVDIRDKAAQLVAPLQPRKDIIPAHSNTAKLSIPFLEKAPKPPPLPNVDLLFNYSCSSLLNHLKTAAPFSKSSSVLGKNLRFASSGSSYSSILSHLFAQINPGGGGGGLALNANHANSKIMISSLSSSTSSKSVSTSSCSSSNNNRYKTMKFHEYRGPPPSLPHPPTSPSSLLSTLNNIDFSSSASGGGGQQYCSSCTPPLGCTNGTDPSSYHNSYVHVNSHIISTSMPVLPPCANQYELLLRQQQLFLQLQLECQHRLGVINETIAVQHQQQRQAAPITKSAPNQLFTASSSISAARNGGTRGKVRPQNGSAIHVSSPHQQDERHSPLITMSVRSVPPPIVNNDGYCYRRDVNHDDSATTTSLIDASGQFICPMSSSSKALVPYCLYNNRLVPLSLPLGCCWDENGTFTNLNKSLLDDSNLDVDGKEKDTTLLVKTAEGVVNSATIDGRKQTLPAASSVKDDSIISVEDENSGSRIQNNEYFLRLYVEDMKTLHVPPASSNFPTHHSNIPRTLFSPASSHINLAPQSPPHPSSSFITTCNAAVFSFNNNSTSPESSSYHMAKSSHFSEINVLVSSIRTPQSYLHENIQSVSAFNNMVVAEPFSINSTVNNNNPSAKILLNVLPPIESTPVTATSSVLKTNNLVHHPDGGKNQQKSPLELLTVPELRGELKRRKMTVSGPKPYLLDRLKAFEEEIIASRVYPKLSHFYKSPSHQKTSVLIKSIKDDQRSSVDIENIYDFFNSSSSSSSINNNNEDSFINHTPPNPYSSNTTGTNLSCTDTIIYRNQNSSKSNNNFFTHQSSNKKSIFTNMAAVATANDEAAISIDNIKKDLLRGFSIFTNNSNLTGPSYTTNSISKTKLNDSTGILHQSNNSTSTTSSGNTSSLPLAIQIKLQREKIAELERQLKRSQLELENQLSLAAAVGVGNVVETLALPQTDTVVNQNPTLQDTPPITPKMINYYNNNNAIVKLKTSKFINSAPTTLYVSLNPFSSLTSVQAMSSGHGPAANFASRFLTYNSPPPGQQPYILDISKNTRTLNHHITNPASILLNNNINSHATQQSGFLKKQHSQSTNTHNLNGYVFSQSPCWGGGGGFQNDDHHNLEIVHNQNGPLYRNSTNSSNTLLDLNVPLLGPNENNFYSNWDGLVGSISNQNSNTLNNFNTMDSYDDNLIPYNLQQQQQNFVKNYNQSGNLRTDQSNNLNDLHQHDNDLNLLFYPENSPIYFGEPETGLKDFNRQIISGGLNTNKNNTSYYNNMSFSLPPPNNMIDSRGSKLLPQQQILRHQIGFQAAAVVTNTNNTIQNNDLFELFPPIEDFEIMSRAISPLDINSILHFSNQIE